MIVYVSKKALDQMQWFPVPDDLDKWYEVETDVPVEELVGLEYSPQTGKFVTPNALEEGIVRASRDALLKEADTLVSIAFDNDDTETLESLKEYRKALRVIPEQEGFPLSINWPTLN